MYSQLLVIFLSLLGFCLFSAHLNTYINRKHYVVFVCFILFLQFGLRNVAVGIDNFAYKLLFDSMDNQTYSSIFTDLSNYFKYNEGDDVGFPLILKMSKSILGDYILYQVLLGFLYSYSIGRFVLKESNSFLDIFLFVVVYEWIFCYFFFTSMRQCIVMSILLFVFRYIKERKFVPFVICIVLLATIHKSVIIMIPFYFIAHFSRKNLLLTIAIVVTPLLIFVARKFASVLVFLSSSDKYAGYMEKESLGGANTFLVFLLLLAILLLYVNITDSKSVSVFNTNMFSVGLFLVPLSWAFPTLLRLAYYFLFIMIVLIPQILSSYALRRNRILFVTMLVAIFIIIIIRNNNAYGFFWEYMQLGENYR